MLNNPSITKVGSFDARFPLPAAAGTDAVHTNPEYCFAVTRLMTDSGLAGTGMVLTLGTGNRIVCELIEELAAPLAGYEIEALMSNFGEMSRRLSNHPQLRWLGPHKGAIHLALASITNASFDLWAKARGVPLWKLLLDLQAEEILRLLDLSGLEDVLSGQLATQLLQDEMEGRPAREHILAEGYPGYDTSVGWFGYDDERIRENARTAMANGFRAFKLKVGSPELERDVRRACMLRNVVGEESLVMLDANQQWSMAQARSFSQRIQDIRPFWIEEPIHPDDIAGHAALAKQISPLRIAAGEHVPNRVVFKNMMQAGAAHFIQVDCTRVGGVSEFLTVSLLARVFGLPIVPHVGDMGQVHQHLVLFNHVAYGHPVVFLEYIPHVREHFVHPAKVEGGVYKTPEEPGASSDLVELAKAE
jgi:L-fuconate dehydratase